MSERRKERLNSVRAAQYAIQAYVDPSRASQPRQDSAGLDGKREAVVAGSEPRGNGHGHGHGHGLGQGQRMEMRRMQRKVRLRYNSGRR